MDISDYAIELTKENAVKLNCNINVIKGDMLDNITEKYDVIVSNPPYIANNEEIEDIVKNNEPHLALYAGSEGLDFYEKILSSANKNLNDKFLIAFEIGAYQADAIKEIAYKYFNNIKIDVYKDLSERDRVLLIYKI